MRRVSLNDNWMVRPKVNRFAELFGASPEWESVTLPHDAMLSGERSPSAGAQCGYFAGGSWDYRRPLEVVADDDAVHLLEFEGVYRDAVVSVNGTVAAHRPYGYSNFFVPIEHLLLPSVRVSVDARA
jgi:beta-galactosidase